MPTKRRDSSFFMQDGRYYKSNDFNDLLENLINSQIQC